MNESTGGDNGQSYDHELEQEKGFYNQQQVFLGFLIRWSPGPRTEMKSNYSDFQFIFHSHSQNTGAGSYLIIINHINTH